jgi:superfamily II DNA or RNA helicase
VEEVHERRLIAMADVIRIKKKNEVFVTVDCDPSIQNELTDFFTFMVPGAKFMPAFKNKLWDGKIRLYDRRLKTLYGGLIEYLHEFAETRSCELEFVDDDYYGRPDAQAFLELDQVRDFVSTLNLYAHGKAIEPRDYQLEAIHHALVHYRAMLLSPTASGKSLIIYVLIRWFLEENPGKKVLLIVPTTSLVEQMFNDFKDYSTLDESWNNEEACHRIYSGKEKQNINSRVVITTWQSIYKMHATWFEPYGMVVGDEAHNFKAKSLASILEKMYDAKYRIGTTGTLDGTQTHKLVLEGLFGPVHRVTTTKALMDSDALAQLSIDVLLMKYDDLTCQAAKQFDYQQEIDFIVGNEDRNRFIRNLAIAQDGNCLILYNYVEKHGKPLYDAIDAKLNEFPRRTRKLFFVSGEVDTNERERIREITEKEKGAIIVASMGTFSTGINIRNLHVIIFASPSKSQIRVLQSIGRGLRKSDDGRATKVYDIADDLHWKKNRNYTLDHAAERIKLYASEKFEYKIHEVKL